MSVLSWLLDLLYPPKCVLCRRLLTGKGPVCPHCMGKLPAFVAVTALVPIFGAWIGGGLGAFLILLAEPGKALWFILFLLVLQQVEGNLIYPKVVGKSVGLPGLLVLMAVTIGGEAFGILGMLFSVPVCAVLYSLYLEFMKKASARH